MNASDFTQAKAHFVGFCRLIRSYAVRLSCHFVATESLSQPFQGSHNSDIMFNKNSSPMEVKEDV